MSVMPLEKIKEKVLETTEMTEAELDKKIKDKMKHLENLVSEEGAAHIIANELGVKMHQTSGPALQEADQGALVELLVGLEEGSVLFVDEIHRLDMTSEEFLYPAMETFRIDHLREGVADSAIKILVYYAHERAWNRVSFGKRRDGEQDYAI